MAPGIPVVAFHLPVSYLDQAQLQSASDEVGAGAVITGHLSWQFTLFSRTNNVLLLLATWREAVALNQPTIEDETRHHALDQLSKRPSPSHCSKPAVGDC